MLGCLLCILHARSVRLDFVGINKIVNLNVSFPGSLSAVRAMLPSSTSNTALVAAGIAGTLFLGKLSVSKIEDLI